MQQVKGGSTLFIISTAVAIWCLSLGLSLARGWWGWHLVVGRLIWRAARRLCQELLPEIVTVDGADILIKQVVCSAHHVEVHGSGKVRWKGRKGGQGVW